MVNKCCVVGCKSNYVHVGAKPEKVSVFKLPKDPIERERWIKNIPREGTPVTPHTVVCAKHWPGELIANLGYNKRPENTRGPISCA